MVWLVVSAFDLSGDARTGAACTWLVVAVLAGTYQFFFPCPRCGRSLGRVWGARRFDWSCRNCELRIGEDPSDGAWVPRT
jgi:predicted RNA-binding Zn-ribbon protein involved in translation (DUF1610 family)